MHDETPAEHNEPRPASKWRAAIRKFSASIAARTRNGCDGLPWIDSAAAGRALRGNIFWRDRDAPKLVAAFLLVVGALLAFNTAMVRKIDEDKNTVREGPPRAQSDGTYLRQPSSTPVRGGPAEIVPKSQTRAAHQFDTLAVMTLLQEIGRDGHGQMVIDSTTLRLLDQAVRNLDGQADTAALTVIGELIEAELPGLEGTKARETFMLYLQYKAAEAQLLQHAQDADRSSVEASLDKTSALRRRYFGAERAAQLFAEEERDLRASLVGLAEPERSLTSQ